MPTDEVAYLEMFTFKEKEETNSTTNSQDREARCLSRGSDYDREYCKID